jgi:hypothetical protein
MANTKKDALSELGRLRAVIPVLEKRLKELEVSIRSAWSLPMSEVVRLKDAVEKESKDVRKQITVAQQSIGTLERVLENLEEP